MIVGSKKKLAAVGAILLGAGAMRLFVGGSEVPDSPGDAMSYICQSDGAVFSLTPRQLENARFKAGGMRAGYAPCPTCGKTSAVPVQIVDGKPVASPPPDDEASDLFPGSRKK
jgi:hypothetical protein